MTADQGGALYAAAARCPPGGRIVEIGSFRGRSTIVLAPAPPPRASRSSPSIPTPATTAARRRSAATPPRRRPTTTRSAANLERGRGRRPGAPRRRCSPTPPTATSTARSTCSTSTAPTATRRRAPTSTTGAHGVARRRHAADPRLVLVGRRDAGDRPRARRRRPVPLRRAIAVAGRVPRRPRGSGGRRVATPPRQLAQLRWFARNVGAQGRARRSGSAGCAARLGRPVPEWPY